MLRDRFRRFHPFAAPAVPLERPQDLQGWHGNDGGETEGDWTFEVDVRGGPGGAARSSVTSCPSCHSSMAVEELDLVGRVARLVCGDCGLHRARRLPSLSSS
jgi:hypothetical protein